MRGEEPYPQSARSHDWRLATAVTPSRGPKRRKPAVLEPPAPQSDDMPRRSTAQLLDPQFKSLVALKLIKKSFRMRRDRSVS